MRKSNTPLLNSSMMCWRELEGSSALTTAACTENWSKSSFSR